MVLSTKKQEKFSIESNLKNLRELKDFSLSEFANEINTSLANVSNYEKRDSLPPIEIQNSITNYFGISTDFLILWNKTPYVHSTKLMKLTKVIDDGDFQQQRYQVESTAKSLMLGLEEGNVQQKEDTIEIELTSSFHENIKLLRSKNELSMQKLADMIGVTSAQIAHYEAKSIPRVDGLIRLSETFNISIHALLTGEKLKYDFIDQHLERTILKADKLLSLKDKDFLIHLMEKIIENSESQK